MMEGRLRSSPSTSQEICCSPVFNIQPLAWCCCRTSTTPSRRSASPRERTTWICSSQMSTTRRPSGTVKGPFMRIAAHCAQQAYNMNAVEVEHISQTPSSIACSCRTGRHATRSGKRCGGGCGRRRTGWQRGRQRQPAKWHRAECQERRRCCGGPGRPPASRLC